MMFPVSRSVNDVALIELFDGKGKVLVNLLGNFHRDDDASYCCFQAAVKRLTQLSEEPT